jgi:hypothetical protein
MGPQIKRVSMTDLDGGTYGVSAPFLAMGSERDGFKRETKK